MEAKHWVIMSQIIEVTASSEKMISIEKGVEQIILYTLDGIEVASYRIKNQDFLKIPEHLIALEKLVVEFVTQTEKVAG